jgi:hypothetical protein
MQDVIDNIEHFRNVNNLSENSVLLGLLTDNRLGIGSHTYQENSPKP